MSQHKSLEYLGKRIASFRKLRGLTQEQLGEAIDRTAQSISDYENGVRVVPMDVLLRMAEALGTSIPVLMGSSNGFAEPGQPYEAEPSPADPISVIFDQLRLALNQAERLVREREALKRR